MKPAINSNLLLALALAVLYPLCPLWAQQSTPYLINYQGRLTNASGQAFADGTYKLRFGIYSKKDGSQAGDTLIWGADYGVLLVGGQFNVVLGAAGGTPVGGAAVNDLGYAFSASEHYLQTSVLTDQNGTALTTLQVLLPRQQLLSVPFAINGNPTGTVLASAAAAAPPGYLFCQGQAVSRTAYPALFAAIGITYGSGDGSATFNLPDMRGRTTIGAGTGSGLTARALAAQLGEEAHILTVSELAAHTHNPRDTGHTHSWTNQRASGGLGNQIAGTNVDDPNPPAFTKSISGKANIVEDTVGESKAHNNMQPSLVLNFIIKY